MGKNIFGKYCKTFLIQIYINSIKLEAIVEMRHKIEATL